MRAPVTGSLAPGRASRGRRPAVGFGWKAVLLGISPAVILFAVFLGLPTVQNLRLSFSRWDGVGPSTWTGLSNYRAALDSGDLWASLWLTLRYAVMCTALIIVVATLLAVAVHSRPKSARFYRVLWFLPAIAPGVAVGVFWSLAFQPAEGVVNALLGDLGLGNQHVWLAQPSTAIYPCVVATVWAGVGLAYLLILGAIGSITDDIYEAARLDGASGLRQLFSITLPLIRPVLVTTSLLEVIWSANGFTLVFAMTMGGPGDATSTLPVLVYNQAFVYSNYGMATAIAVIGGVIMLGVGSLMIRFSGQRGMAES